MKITLISTGSKQDKGPKIISNFLKNNNHSPQVLFYAYTTPDIILKKVKNSGLIVVSANPSTCSQASELLKLLKPLNIPLAYAGIYPQDSPDECIKEIDLIIF